MGLIAILTMPFVSSIGSTTFDDGFRERYKIDYSVLEITQVSIRAKTL